MSREGTPSGRRLKVLEPDQDLLLNQAMEQVLNPKLVVKYRSASFAVNIQTLSNSFAQGIEICAPLFPIVFQQPH